MKKNKLHIFGCSHSTPCGIDDNDAWYFKLANKLKLEQYKRIGQTGMGSFNIFFDMLHRIYMNDIDKNDYVILNTSYSSRWSTVNLPQIDNNKNRLGELLNNIVEPNGNSFSTNEGEFDFKSDSNTTIVFLQWIINTTTMYHILKKYCDNVSIWFLDDPVLLNTICETLLELGDEYWGNLGIDNMGTTPPKFDINEFGNDVIIPPNDNKNNPYPDWHSWINDNSLVNDGHMNKFAHHYFSEYINNFITQKNTK
tara:strand:- start:269 stop:1027 length:759 start_codon:yes stop_codon:yes gene_type:complete